MFDQRNRGKIKNDKIMRWRIELACYSFDIVYRPGKENVLPNALSRATCASASQDSLYKLHEALCHPGITRLNHFIRTKNLPYSLEEVKRVTSQCQTCAETKPRYHKPEEVPLIKATQPFEWINIDFKGPLPSNNGNKYFLNIVDEYSRFPFVFPCSDISTSATNETPHERFFRFPRRSSSGASIPTWMAEPGAVLLKRHVRPTKADPLVDEVELLQANPHYAFVRYPDGRETTVSTKHLAPKPTSAPQNQILPTDSVLESTVGNSPSSVLPAHVQQEVPTATEQINVTVGSEQPTCRRSGRIRHPVDRLNL